MACCSPGIRSAVGNSIMFDSGATHFAGLFIHTIDLSQYLEPEASVSVRSASYFAERTIDILEGRMTAKGLPLPWAKAADKFAFRPGELTVWTGYKAHGKSMLLSQVLLYAM